MAKKYLEMGLKSKAVKTTDISSSKIPIQSPKINSIATTLSKANLDCEFKIINEEMNHQKNSTNAMKRLFMAMSFKSVRRIGYSVFCLATRNSFPPHSKR